MKPVVIYAFGQTRKFDHVNLWNFVYLHGLLEDKVGFDLVGCLDRPQKEGVYDAVVVLPDNNCELAKLFYWKDGDKDRGLVVSVNDNQEVLDYAKDKFYKKSKFL